MITTPVAQTVHRRSSRPFLVLVVLILAIALAGCGGKKPEEPKGQPFLPRITLNFDEQGMPQLGALGVAAKLLNFDVSAYRLPAETVQQMMAAGVQHVEAVVGQDGILLYVNGQPVPYLALDEQSRQNIGQLLTLLNVPNPAGIQKLIDNVITRVNVPVVLKFPVPAGQQEIPLREQKVFPTVNVEEARSSAGVTPLVLHADVAIDANGVPTIAGSSLTDYQDALAVAGIPVDLSTARMDQATLARLAAANIQLVQVETEPEGIYLYLNGAPLPRIAWDDERLANGLALYEKLEPDNAAMPLLKFLQPYLRPSDIELSLYLPQPPGAPEVTPSPFVQ